MLLKNKLTAKVTVCDLIHETESAYYCRTRENQEFKEFPKLIFIKLDIPLKRDPRTGALEENEEIEE